MPIVPATRVEVRDEGTSQGFVRTLDFVGAGVVAAVSGTVATVTISGGGAGGGSTYTDFTKDLGVSRSSGTFDITGLSGLTPNQNVLVFQTVKAITSKGDARDESEMDMICCTGYVVDATTIRVKWFSANGAVVTGTYAFAYSVGA